MKGRVGKLHARRRRRLQSVRRRVRGSAERVRLTVQRSNKQIYVQAVDDITGATVASSSSMGKDVRQQLEGNKTVRASVVGADIAKKLLDRGYKKAVLDRGWYRYHGRVKALADAAREAGLDF